VQANGPPLDAIPCGIVSFLDDGTVTFANRWVCDLLGVEPADLLGRHVESMLSVGSRIFYQTHLFPLLRLHGAAYEMFVLLRASDGTDIGTLLNAVRRERDGHLVTDCVLLRVEERTKFEAALIRAKTDAEEARAMADEANRAKSVFLTMMSHELRTPLNAIGGYAELLEMGIHGPLNDAQTAAMAKLAKSQRHLLKLINEVLNLARIESGHVHYDIEPVGLRDVVEAVLPLVEPQLAARRVRCAVDVPTDLVAQADRDKLEQILLNLLSNASKFTPPDGLVTIDATMSRDPHDRVHLSVRDTGAGIAPDRLDHIFEPFVQVDVNLSRRAEGTGLGLAISRDLARGMGGDLRVRSHEGAGSSFTVTLPRHVG
jgi:signal transduction histidine kinase